MNTFKFILATLILTAPLSYAQLVFDETTVEHEAVDSETAFEAVFTFRNAGEETVEVMDPQSSCGCTVPRLEKRSYAPGEEGEIRAVFTYGSRKGPQSKSITVPTSAGAHNLQLRVNIPIAFELDKRLLFWREEQLGQPLEAKLSFHKNAPVDLMSEPASSDIYSFKLTPNKTKSEYTIQVTPNGAYRSGIDRTDMSFRDAKGNVHKVTLYLRLL